MKKLYVSVLMLACCAWPAFGQGCPAGMTSTAAGCVSRSAGIAPATVDNSGNVVTPGSVTTGYGSAYTGSLEIMGITSAAVGGFTVPDSFASSVLYVLPTVSSGNYLQDAGSTTCPTNAPGAPASCEALSWATPSGTGNPYLTPSTPTPIVAASWADFNMTSCSRTNSGNFEQLVSNATSNNNVCGRTIAFPAGAFTKTLAVMPLLQGTNYATVGFGVTDGTKVSTCSIQNSTGTFLNGAKCANSTTCSANYTVATPYPVASGTIQFFRLTDDGAGNLACQWSPDGTFFTQLWTDKDTTGAGGYQTPTKLIYFVNSATSNKVNALTVIGYQ